MGDAKKPDQSNEFACLKVPFLYPSPKCLKTHRNHFFSSHWGGGISVWSKFVKRLQASSYPNSTSSYSAQKGVPIGWDLTSPFLGTLPSETQGHSGIWGYFDQVGTLCFASLTFIPVHFCSFPAIANPNLLSPPKPSQKDCPWCKARSEKFQV
eukprot:EG_transcript_26981